MTVAERPAGQGAAARGRKPPHSPRGPAGGRGLPPQRARGGGGGGGPPPPAAPPRPAQAAQRKEPRAGPHLGEGNGALLYGACP